MVLQTFSFGQMVSTSTNIWLKVVMESSTKRTFCQRYLHIKMPNGDDVETINWLNSFSEQPLEASRHSKLCLCKRCRFGQIGTGRLRRIFSDCLRWANQRGRRWSPRLSKRSPEPTWITSSFGDASKWQPSRYSWCKFGEQCVSHFDATGMSVFWCSLRNDWMHFSNVFLLC